MLWMYKAYDADELPQSGAMEANSFEELALQLRQSGLQVYDAWLASPSDGLTKVEIKLSRLRNKFQPRPLPRKRSYLSLLATSVGWCLAPVGWVWRLVADVVTRLAPAAWVAAKTVLLVLSVGGALWVVKHLLQG